jgi:hypothetical protein
VNSVGDDVIPDTRLRPSATTKRLLQLLSHHVAKDGDGLGDVVR